MHDDTTATEFGAAMDKYRTAADVIDVIEGEGWAVEDYDLTVDRFGDRQGLTLELEPTPWLSVVRLSTLSNATSPPMERCLPRHECES